ncbi:MAG: hypothetical protein V4565_14615 [Bacteroidota bacterium]
MKNLETTKYFIISKRSLRLFFNRTFIYENPDKIYEIGNLFFESQILNDINCIQYNSINFGDNLKANQYLSILHKSLRNAYWKIFKYSTNNSENETEMEIDNILIDSLTEHLHQLLFYVLDFRNNYFPNANSIQDNYAITDEKSNIINMPLMAVRSQFAALIDTEQLKDGNGTPIKKSNAGKILSEHITFLQKDGKPYEKSVVSRYFSSSFDRNDKNEFIEPYNECVEILDRPKLKKSKKRT